VRVLLDVVHPAHVHFFRPMIEELTADGHQTEVVARDKDVTTDLLDHFGIPYTSVGAGGGSGLWRMGVELVRRDLALLRIARRFRPDVIVTRNPAGVQAARLAGVPGIFDTDDGREVGLHFRAAAPFADIITTPACIADDFGRKHRPYPSFKALAFLHPNRFTPDPGVLDILGVAPGERYFVVRFVAFAAAQDRRERGLSDATKFEVVERLRRHGRVFVSSESALPPALEAFALPTPPHRMHDVLAFSSLCVTDGQSMAGEAAVLGVPSVRSSSFAGRLDVLREMSETYGLVWEHLPGDVEGFLGTVERLAAGDGADEWSARRRRLLDDTCDLTAWMLDLVEETAATRRLRTLGRLRPRGRRTPRPSRATGAG
jgi:predicted glycosyltransferase